MVDEAGVAMPRYRCYKEVFALKIRSASMFAKGGGRLEFEESETYAPIVLPAEVFARYKPVAGDYYVVYDDGYTSFSPARAFEDGYTRI